MFPPLPSTFEASRHAIHAVAEMVLANARYLTDEEVGLRPWPGGLATPPLPPAGTVYAVVGQQLARVDDSGDTRVPLTTLVEAGRFVGVEPGVPGGLWPPETAFGPDQELAVDAAGAAALAGWYEFGAEVLDRFRAEAASDGLEPLTLWPEHFDLATHDGQRANYGASPGDGPGDEPYLYVGPWARPLPAPDDPFWNRSFGAALTYSSVESIDAAVAFLRRGRALVLDAAPA